MTVRINESRHDGLARQVYSGCTRWCVEGARDAHLGETTIFDEESRVLYGVAVSDDQPAAFEQDRVRHRSRRLVWLLGRNRSLLRCTGP